MYRRTIGWAGLAIFCLCLALSMSAPFITRHDPTTIGDFPLHAPGSEYWFGTNELGQDILSQVLYGGKNSMLMAVAGASLTAVMGTLIGMAAGYFGKGIDQALCRFTDLLMAIPTFPLIILLSAVYSPSLFCLGLLMGAFGWGPCARIVRSQTLSLVEWNFVQGVRAMGASDTYILFRYIFPFVAPLSVVKLLLAMQGYLLMGGRIGVRGSWGALQSRVGTDASPGIRWRRLGLRLLVAALFPDSGGCDGIPVHRHDRLRPGRKNRPHARKGRSKGGGSMSLLDAANLEISFHIHKEVFRVAGRIDLTLEKGKTLVIAGESGCGKSAFAMSVAGILPPNARVGGSIRYRGMELVGLDQKKLRSLRGEQIGFIPQSSSTCLNPVLRIETQFAHVLKRSASKVRHGETIARIFDELGLERRVARMYPHQLSEGDERPGPGGAGGMPEADARHRGRAHQGAGRPCQKGSHGHVLSDSIRKQPLPDHDHPRFRCGGGPSRQARNHVCRGIRGMGTDRLPAWKYPLPPLYHRAAGKSAKQRFPSHARQMRRHTESPKRM